LKAQLERTGTPVSWNQQLTVPIANEWVSEANVALLLEEDASQIDDRSVAYRFAYAHEVAWDMDNSGSWVNLANGDRLWILGISYDGAHSISVTMNQLQIPKGGRLYLYSEDHLDFIGPLTEDDNRTDEITLPHVHGEKVFLEYYEPRSYRGEGSLTVSHVAGAYRNDVEEAVPMQGCAQWLSDSPAVLNSSQASSAVMRVLVDHGQRYATAVLINNALNNAEPYVILPTQLLNENPSSLVFQFGVNSMDCFAQQYACNQQSICGAEFLCVDSEHSMALVRLSSSPRSDWDAYFAGWSISANLNESHYCVQHPKGLAKSFSRYDDGFMPLTQGEEELIGLSGSGSGQTYGGSLGSPLLDENGNVLGIFVGGNTRCNNNGGFDRFVMLSDVWLTFRQFLDPLQSSADRIPGMDTPPVEMEANQHVEMLVFPNPAMDQLNLVASASAQPLSSSIYDAAGRLLQSYGSQNVLDVSVLNEGVYVLKITTGEGVVSHSVMITKK
jgi:hypothetical protein